MRRSLAALATVFTLVPGGAAAYVVPVPGAVVVAFDPPSTPYGPGHRGVDLEVSTGDAVLAAAPGTVVFAGVVAGTGWITVEHADGLRTSYGPVEPFEVARGQQVSGGQRLGVATSGHGDGPAATLHWSARTPAGRYVDPLTLVTPPAPWRPSLVGPGGWVPTGEPSVPSYGPWRGEHHWWGGVPGSPVAEGPGWVFPPNPNLVVSIAGLSSSTGAEAIALEDLGYAAEAIHRFGYGDPGDPLYSGADTLLGVHRAATVLREQLRRLARDEPGRAVDLVGHSLGGVVALWYLFTLHDPADPTLPPVAHVATIAAPIGGADLASALRDAQRNPFIAWLTEAVAGRLADSRTLADLEVGSELLGDLDRRWQEARADPWSSPLATGTRIATFGASRDLAVAEHRTDLSGAPHVVLPGGHDGVRFTEASRIALRAFLADQALPGESGGLGHLLSYPLGAIEGVIGDLLAPPLPIAGWP